MKYRNRILRKFGAIIGMEIIVNNKAQAALCELWLWEFAPHLLEKTNETK